MHSATVALCLDHRQSHSNDSDAGLVGSGGGICCYAEGVLLQRPVLERIVSGTQRVVFRRWLRPSVRAGGQLKTALGVLAIDAVVRVEPQSIDETTAQQAGYPSRAELLHALSDRDGELYRIDVRYHGADPRSALRERATLTSDELSQVRARLTRFDAASRQGPWTEQVLRTIAAHPATLAAKLAKKLGYEALVFKRNVRKLKELGLTESLEIGYRVSPRGKTLLDSLGD